MHRSRSQMWIWLVAPLASTLVACGGSELDGSESTYDTNGNALIAAVAPASNTSGPKKTIEVRTTDATGQTVHIVSGVVVAGDSSTDPILAHPKVDPQDGRGPQTPPNPLDGSPASEEDGWNGQATVQLGTRANAR